MSKISSSKRNIDNKLKNLKTRCPNCGDNNATSLGRTFFQCNSCNYLWDNWSEKFDGIPNMWISEDA